MLKNSSLLDYFQSGCKKPSAVKMGVEWEKVGVYKETAKAIGYSGPRGVEAIFKSLIRQYGWAPIRAEEFIIGLKKNRSTITLEPGGQIELSGSKAPTLNENAVELYQHLGELKQVSEPLGIAWLGLGAQPKSRASEIEWVPKPRYAIMRQSLRHKGALTTSMMKETASIQISLDYTSEDDAAQKLRLAMALAPFLSAMFANSPFSGGTPCRFLSRRTHIWMHTAPERTGILEAAFHHEFGFRDYAEYALKVPMLFIVRKGKWLKVKNRTFKQFLQRGYAGHSPRLEDWELHLTTIFTEARLKTYLEIRSVDGQNRAMGLAAAAFLKGLFYDEASRKKAWERVAGLKPSQIQSLRQEAAQKGLGTRWQGQSFLAMARDLLKLSEGGLQKLAQTKLAGSEESKYLAPLKKLILEEGITPAQALLRCVEKGRPTPKERLDRILACAAV